jgi:hypothetical protein
MLIVYCYFYQSLIYERLIRVLIGLGVFSNLRLYNIHLENNRVESAVYLKVNEFKRPFNQSENKNKEIL